MPGYPWLAEAKIDGEDLQARMRTLRTLGDPYSDAQIAGAADAVQDKTELDALVAYLQGLGVKGAPATATPETVAPEPAAPETAVPEAAAPPTAAVTP
jgi:cytochrome c oxidase cbb3-type subunit 2